MKLVENKNGGAWGRGKTLMMSYNLIILNIVQERIVKDKTKRKEKLKLLMIS
jgi:hypothetical protein